MEIKSLNLRAAIGIGATFLLVACGPSEEERKQLVAEEERKLLVADSQNACAEIDQTSRGYGGPSKRMDILKSYGLQPRQAKTLEEYFTLMFDVADVSRALKEAGSSGAGFASKVSCMKEAMITCSEAYISAALGKEAILRESAKRVNACAS